MTILISICQAQTLDILYDEPKDSIHGLALDSKSNFYFLNNEYFNGPVPGETILGNNSEVSLAYGKELHYLRAGVMAQLAYGAPMKVNWFPVFTAHYALSPDYSFTLGTLGNGANHKIPIQLMGNETLLNDPLEYGLRFNISKKKFGLESWLDWRQLVDTAQSKSEQFTQGNSIYFIPYADSVWSVKGNAGALFYHNGGQGLTVWKPTYTYLNYFASIKVDYHWTKAWKFGFQYSFLGFRNSKKVAIIPWSSGNAHEAAISIDYKGFSSLFAYYKSNQLYAPFADALFAAGDFSLPQNEMFYCTLKWTSTPSRPFRFTIGCRLNYYTALKAVDYNYFLATGINISTEN